MIKIVIFISLVIFVVGCSSCNKIEQHDTKKNNIKRVYKQPVQPGLSPGTVSIEATVLSYAKNKNSLFLVIDKIINSGHSTPDLAVGEKISVNVSSEKLYNQIEDNDSLRAIIKYSRQKVGETNSNAWRLINIK